MATSIGLLSASWIFFHRLFGDAVYFAIAALSIELLILLVAIVWLNPRPMLSAVSAPLLLLVVVSIATIVSFGIPQAARFVLMTEGGWISNRILRFPSLHDSASLKHLRAAIRIALRRGSFFGTYHAPPPGNDVRKLFTSRENGLQSDIILISIDSLRPDRLDCYGANRRLSPNIDAFASTARIFLNAFTTAPMTVPSFMQTMSGSFEHELPHIFASPKGPIILIPNYPTIAFRLGQIGYRTHAISPVFTNLLNYAQGFSLIEASTSEGHPLRASESLERILDDLRERRGAPVFLWSHLMDLHNGSRESATGLRGVAAYDKAVSDLDRKLGVFFAELAKQDRGRNALVIITADHGEALGENGLFYHGFMTPKTLRVPLLIRFPGLGPGSTANPVSLIDLAPTILTLVDSVHDYTGLDLHQVVSESSPAEVGSRDIFHESLRFTDSPQLAETGITRLPWQLIYDFDRDTLALFNLEVDPRGERNLAGRGLPIEPLLVNTLAVFYEGEGRGTSSSTSAN
jgi:hypothetical protein